MYRALPLVSICMTTIAIVFQVTELNSNVKYIKNEIEKYKLVKKD